jgi:hypothetical protein
MSVVPLRTKLTYRPDGASLAGASIGNAGINARWSGLGFRRRAIVPPSVASVRIVQTLAHLCENCNPDSACASPKTSHAFGGHVISNTPVRQTVGAARGVSDRPSMLTRGFYAPVQSFALGSHSEDRRLPTAPTAAAADPSLRYYVRRCTAVQWRACAYRYFCRV